MILSLQLPFHDFGPPSVPEFTIKNSLGSRVPNMGVTPSLRDLYPIMKRLSERE